MKAAIFHGPGRIAIEDVPDDPLGPHDLRIEVARCGVCGSDVAMTSGTPFDYPAGCRLGHETAGTVIEAGPQVTRFRVGDRVAVMPSGPCGQCAMCRANRPLFCTDGRMQFGGFGERMVITESSAFRYPDSVSHAEGALVEPIACGRRAMRMARIEPGASVLVLGAGSMGMWAIFWARRMGAGRIVVATRSGGRDAGALAMGADEAIRLTADDPDAVARALGGPPDIVVEAIGKPGALELATGQVPIGGTLVSLGMCISQDPVLPVMLGSRDMSIHFPVAWSVEDFIETIRAFDEGSVQAGAMVSEVLPLSALPALIEEMRGPHAHQKVQIAPGG